MTKTLKLKLILFVNFICFLGCAQEKSIVLTDAEFTVKNRNSETFYYGLKKGDVFKIQAFIPGGITSVSVGEYDAEIIESIANPDSIANISVQIYHDGIYYVKFHQSGFLAGRRHCYLKSERFVIDPANYNFNSTVYWKTVVDTSYYFEQEKYLVKTDTIVNDLISENVKIGKKGKVNQIQFKFSIPDSAQVISYWIATGKEASKQFLENEQKIKQTNSLVKQYGLMGALAMENVGYYSVNSDCIPITTFFFIV